MTKAELRSKYKKMREQLSTEEIDKRSYSIALSLEQVLPEDVSTIHIFLPIARFHELNTYLIKDYLHSRFPSIQWIISKTDFESMSMSNLIWNEETSIEISSFGIPEPISGTTISTSQIDLVLVPLLAFDTQGHRLGYGKGFYDRFLSNCRPDCITVGLSLFDAEEELPVDEWDVPLQFCVCPEKTYRF